MKQKTLNVIKQRLLRARTSIPLWQTYHTYLIVWHFSFGNAAVILRCWPLTYCIWWAFDSAVCVWHEVYTVYCVFSQYMGHYWQCSHMENWIELVSTGLICFIRSTRMAYGDEGLRLSLRVFSCLGLPTCPLNVSPSLGHLVSKNVWLDLEYNVLPVWPLYCLIVEWFPRNEFPRHSFRTKWLPFQTNEFETNSVCKMAAI